MNTAAENEAAEVQRGHFNPYQLDPAHVLEPPTRMRDILRQIGRKLPRGGRMVLDIYHHGFFERNQGTRHFEREGRAISETKHMVGDRLIVTLDYGPDVQPDTYAWQLFSPAQITDLARQCGFGLLLACAAFDSATPASAELARMQLVFERI